MTVIKTWKLSAGIYLSCSMANFLLTKFVFCFNSMTEKTRGEKTKKKGKEQTVQQRISQEAEGQRTAVDKGEG